MRQLIRRLRSCEAGAGTVEYALLLAILAIGLMGVLELFRNSVGGVANRTAVSVSARASGGYGVRVSGGSSGGTIAQMPLPEEEPDSTSVEPDSSSTAGGTAASLDPNLP